MRKFNKVTLAVCIAEIIIVVGGMTACGAKKNNNVTQQKTVVTSETRQETTSQNESQQETMQVSEMQQEMALLNEKQPTAAQTSTAQQNTNQPIPSGDEQISLETAKNTALTDAGVSDSDVIYTKQKLDFEDGIAVYDIEFYAGNVEYEYEINASTGAVYSKSMETYHNQAGHGHEGHVGASQADIGADSAKSIALNHAGFAEADVSRLKTEFDIDDGLAVYEVEFDKNGIEYEYKINAVDGSIIEYDID